MGLVYLRILSAKFFNLVAWPPFALVFPLYASIRAVESDKNYQQCLNYWVLFSITTIFESTFAKPLQWLTFWPYVKGLATLLLVLPCFDGASYIYMHFIRPFICRNSQLRDILLTSETKGRMLHEQNGFLDAAKGHDDENVEHELIKHVIHEDKSRLNRDIEEIVQTQPENLKEVQKEWSCALCLVSTTSKECLIKHIQGMKHKAKEEELSKGEVVTNKRSEIVSTTKSTNRMVSIESFNQTLSNLLSPVARSIRWCSWKKPKFGWMKLNTDGYIDKDGAGFGGLFRDHKGDALCAYVSKASHHDIFLVELWAVWRGLILASGLGINVIWVESDSQSVVNTINKKQPYGPKASSWLKHIWEILKKFDKYQVSHSWREANRAADHVAKMDLVGSDVVLWPYDFPSSLYKIISDDAQGKRYRRG